MCRCESLDDGWDIEKATVGRAKYVVGAINIDTSAGWCGVCFELWWWRSNGDVKTRWRGSVVPAIEVWMSWLSVSLWGGTSFRRGVCIWEFC